MINVTKRRAMWTLAGICVLGAAFRFYHLAWGAQYYHFQMDEHFVMGPATVLRRDPRAAAMGSKFFMISLHEGSVQIPCRRLTRDWI